MQTLHEIIHRAALTHADMAQRAQNHIDEAADDPLHLSLRRKRLAALWHWSVAINSGIVLG